MKYLGWWGTHIYTYVFIWMCVYSYIFVHVHVYMGCTYPYNLPNHHCPCTWWYPFDIGGQYTVPGRANKGTHIHRGVGKVLKEVAKAPTTIYLTSMHEDSPQSTVALKIRWGKRRVRYLFAISIEIICNID